MTGNGINGISGPMRPLTKTQQRVCDGIGRGLTYAEIGQELGALEDKAAVSEHTVRSYVREIAMLFTGMHHLEPKVRIWIAMQVAQAPR